MLQQREGQPEVWVLLASSAPTTTSTSPAIGAAPGGADLALPQGQSAGTPRSALKRALAALSALPGMSTFFSDAGLEDAQEAGLAVLHAVGLSAYAPQPLELALHGVPWRGQWFYVANVRHTASGHKARVLVATGSAEGWPELVQQVSVDAGVDLPREGTALDSMLLVRPAEGGEGYGVSILTAL